MKDNFYEFLHECDEMPEELDSICRIKGSRSSQATYAKYISGVGTFSTTLYDWKFCPYCGEKLERSA